MSRRRRLSPEDERLWERVKETANPMTKPAPVKRLKANKKPAPSKPDPDPFSPTVFRVGEQSAPAPSTRISVQDQPVRMDQKAFSRLKRGKSKPDARIDLHGMTAATAHTALIAFLLRAHADGKRLVLVITGKGRSVDDVGQVPRQAGVLRRQLPHWLELPPLRQIVLQTTPAHQRHGGSGAFYVYLRR